MALKLTLLAIFYLVEAIASCFDETTSTLIYMHQSAIALIPSTNCDRSLHIHQLRSPSPLHQSAIALPHSPIAIILPHPGLAIALPHLAKAIAFSHSPKAIALSPSHIYQTAIALSISIERDRLSPLPPLAIALHLIHQVRSPSPLHQAAIALITSTTSDRPLKTHYRIRARNSWY